MAAADTALAGELGVSPTLVLSFRREKMTLGVHWEQDATGKVKITSAGRVLVLQELRPPGAPQVAEGIPPMPLQCVSQAFTIWTAEVQQDLPLVIVKIHSNRHWVRVRTPDDSMADVQVKTNTTLRKRVKLLCRKHSDGRWECRHRGYAVPLEKKEGAPG